MAPHETIAFLRAFLKNPGRTGAIAPSSAVLARAMVRGLHLAPGETVVEFGPGTGAFTGAIRAALAAPDDYVGFEVNAEFVKLLGGRFPGLRVIHDSAARAPAHLAAMGRDSVRAVICGLPFASLPPGVQDDVIGALDRLMRPGSEFRTFQYVHAYWLPPAVRFRRRMLQRVGPCVRIATVWPNLPPAFVLQWKR